MVSSTKTTIHPYNLMTSRKAVMATGVKFAKCPAIRFPNLVKRFFFITSFKEMTLNLLVLKIPRLEIVCVCNLEVLGGFINRHDLDSEFLIS